MLFKCASRGNVVYNFQPRHTEDITRSFRVKEQFVYVILRKALQIAPYNLAIYILSVSDKSSHSSCTNFSLLHGCTSSLPPQPHKSEARVTLKLKSFLITITCHVYSVKGI